MIKDEFTVNQESVIRSYRVVITPLDEKEEPVDKKQTNMILNSYILIGNRIVDKKYCPGITMAGIAEAINFLLLKLPNLLEGIQKNLSLTREKKEGVN